ncbi:hypothetical protein [Streptomyces sp. NPDC059008]|uniref:hypothetical protein n=1 Tax=Streptomyces sp. NPDC059008 TaxID=3346693 RepID=UPI0036B18DFE
MPRRERYVGQRRGILGRHIRHDRQIELGVGQSVAEEGDMVRDRAQMLAKFPAVGGVEPLAPGGGGVDELLQIADGTVVLIKDLLQDLGDVGRATQLVQLAGQRGQ